jgi:hypothetical protein
MLRYIACYLERNLKSIEFIRLLRQQTGADLSGVINSPD